MRAIQITEQGGPEVLTPVELPDPVPGPGEILIRVGAAAVNFADVMRRRGTRYPFPTPLPFVPGGEVAGTVAALGDGVDGPPVGTPVFALVGADGSGGYAELAVAAAPQVVPIPAGLPEAEAAGVIIAGSTATLLLTAAGQLQAGQSLFVPAAAGGVGGLTVQIAKLLGAGTVIAGASTDARRSAALGLGADHAVDTTADWPTAVRELTGGQGVDLALEMSGGDELDRTLAALAPFGTAVVYGMAGGRPARIADATLDALLYDPALNQSVRAFNLGLWFGLRPQEAGAALGRLIGWVAAGQLRLPVRTLPLEQAAEAHRLLETRSSQGKLVLVP